MLGKLFGKKSGQARAAVAKLANRDLMEAVVYGSIYVAAADGDLEDSELTALERSAKLLGLNLKDHL